MESLRKVICKIISRIYVWNSLYGNVESDMCWEYGVGEVDIRRAIFQGYSLYGLVLLLELIQFSLVLKK